MTFLDKEGLNRLWIHIQNKLNEKANIQDPSFSGSLSMNGEAWVSGDVYVGSNSGTNKDEGSKKLATEEYVDTLKKDKDIIVTYAEGSHTTVTHNSQDIYNEIISGTTVYFQKGTELLSVLEADPSYITFFMFYVNMNNKLQQKVVVVSGDSVAIDQDDTYDYATTASLKNYYDKTEVDDLLEAKVIPNNLLNGTAEGSVRGVNTLAESDSYTMGVNAFAIGNGTKASGKNSFASGQDVEATGSYAHAEGYGTFATAAASHAEGYDTHATARYAHAEGASTTASGNNSHAEGNSTTSSGHYSHAEGNFTTAAGAYSHAEGNYTQTTENGTYSHVEGSYTKASKTGAHAEGNYAEANGAFSHAEGYYTKAESMYQHVRGKYNITDDANIYATIIGNGDADTNRKNIHTLDWEGNTWYQGDIYVGSTSGTNKDEGSKKVATEDWVSNLYMKLNSNTVLGFYCIEDVTIVTNGVSKVYPANSNVEVTFIEGDTFEIVPTSDNSILQLNAYPGALGTYYPWLEGVRQFSNILFDMNDVEFYSKWSQGNQGAYQVQFAQYTNCIFWSDNAYISDVNKRTNYTLYYTSQLPLCYSTIPDNTFKAFFLAFGVNNDPNWGNPVYRESFSKANWATQAFSYYGARTIGVFGHDSSLFNIVLPKDCRGLFCESTAIENAGTFDAINVTNFGAKSGSWRDAFRMCYSLRQLYIKNLKVNLNISWSPIDYSSIYYIISEAANTNAITISVSPYTYYLLRPADFELAASKNITIELLTTNYIEDIRLSAITDDTIDSICSLE